MTRSQRIRRIVTLADGKRRNASTRVSASRQARDQNQQQLAQFRAYRAEYQRSLAAGGATMSAQQARELRDFLGQIERTISMLEARVRDAEQRYRDDVEGWKRESHRTRVLGDIADRAQLDEDAESENALQREIDERAARGGPRHD